MDLICIYLPFLFVLNCPTWRIYLAGRDIKVQTGNTNRFSKELKTDFLNGYWDCLEKREFNF